VSIKASNVLAQQGRTGREFVFIVEGKAQVKKDGKVISHLSSGEFFGEISLIDGEPQTATVYRKKSWFLFVRTFEELRRAKIDSKIQIFTTEPQRKRRYIFFRDRKIGEVMPLKYVTTTLNSFTLPVRLSPQEM
jgi:CRP-like cAMP-binding protein